MISLASDPPQTVKDLLSKVHQQNSIFQKEASKIIEIIKNALNKKFEIPLQENKPKPKPATKRVEAHRPTLYQKKYNVTLLEFEKLSIFGNQNVKPNQKVFEKCQNVAKNFDSIFQIVVEEGMEMEIEDPEPGYTKPKISLAPVHIEEFPSSIQEKYQLPLKNKLPNDRKIKSSDKKQKLSDKKDIRIGWLDNIELAPVKRRNLFKKKR